MARFGRIVVFEDHLQFARLQIRYFQVVEGLKELVQTQVAALLTVDQFKLALQSYVAAHSSHVQSLAEFLEQ